MKMILIFLAVFLNFSVAEAQGWVSSGGEVFIERKNPWFLRNTQQVDYCILMDETSFSVTRVEAEKLIEESFAFWAEQFKEVSGTSSGPQLGFTPVATQKFVLHSRCEPEFPLVFKLGRKELMKDEVDHLKEPLKFIGVSIQKSYDPVNMRGSGVIYISADKGPDAYENKGQLVDQAWRFPQLLKYTLVHELGHVFGIPHVGSGMMSEVFMNVLLSTSMYKSYAEGPFESFLTPPANFEVCRSDNDFNAAFFLLTNQTQCLFFEKFPTEIGRWKVLKKDQLSDPYTQIGELKGDTVSQSVHNLKPAVIVHLPKEQKIFSHLETILGPFLMGAIFSDVSVKGFYRTTTSARPYAVQMSLQSTSVNLVGTVGGKQETVLHYEQNSFMKALIPSIKGSLKPARH